MVQYLHFRILKLPLIRGRGFGSWLKWAKSSKYRYRLVEKNCVWHLLKKEIRYVFNVATTSELPAQDHCASLPTSPVGVCEMRFGLDRTTYLKSYAIVPLHALVGQNHRQCIPLADHQIVITLDELRAVGLSDHIGFTMYTKHCAVINLFPFHSCPCKICDCWHWVIWRAMGIRTWNQPKSLEQRWALKFNPLNLIQNQIVFWWAIQPSQSIWIFVPQSW